MNHKIIKLKVQNFKNLRAIEITPDGNVISLTGENGAGKSALLDSMQSALAGGTTGRPIRDGAAAADIVVELGGGLVAHKRYTPSGATLRVTKDGEPQATPAALLESLSNGALGFDPLSFSRLKPEVQRETFLKLVGLDFTAHDKERASVYTERTTVNREVDRLAARLKGCKQHTDAPAEVVAASALLAQISEAEKHNTTIDAAHAETKKFESIVASKETEILNAEAQIASWKKVLESLMTQRDHARNSMNASGQVFLQMTKIPTEPLRDKLVTLEADNAKVTENLQTANVKQQLHDVTNESNALTDKITKLDEAKAAAIRDAKSPLAGLTFDDAGLIYEGRPLTEASSGQRIRVCVSIGMALNPKLRVIFVRDGSLLDAEGLKVMAELAAANDYQVWIEDARSEDPAALVIEDGSLLIEKEKV